MANTAGTKHRPKGAKPRTRLELYVWSSYRLSLEEYNALIEKGCSVCGSQDRLCIDHDHNCCLKVNKDTGKRTNKTCGKCIRGVLCRKHNLVEGMLSSSAEEALAMYEYMAK